MKSILTNYESASFCQLLSLLLEHNVAYPAAVVLAAESTGNRKLTDGARLLAADVKWGAATAQAMGKLDKLGFMPMLSWVLKVGQQQGSLVQSLHSLAKTYRNRAKFQPERRIMADFNRSVKDVAHAARRFRTIDGINSDDNQIAVPPLGEQRTKGRVTGESAIPIWLAINLHGAKELRQTG